MNALEPATGRYRPTLRAGDPDNVGRRPLPRVRRAPILLFGERSEAIRESIPFLFFGFVCLLIAIWLYVADPAPGNPLAIWILLLGIGLVAIAGGTIGIFLPGEPVAVSREVVYRSSRGFESPRGREPLSSSRPAARPRPAVEPRPVAHRPLSRPVEPSPEAVSVAAMPAARSSVRQSPPPASPPAASGARFLAPDEASSDDVLASINELSGLMRSNRPSRPSADPDGPEVEICSSCEAPLPPGITAPTCHECRGAMCDACVDRGAAAGRPGLCPTCASLSTPIGRRAASPRPPASNG